MGNRSGRRLLSDARRIFSAALQAVDPGQAVRRALRVDRDAVQIIGDRLLLPDMGKLWVVGAGKGSAAMAAAEEDLLGDRISGGRVTVKYGYGVPLKKVTLGEAGHPRPDERGLEEARAVLGLLAATGPDDLVICLISGGGSALWPAPAEGISLTDKMQTTKALLSCGATINQMNCVRKHISRIKGGQLARHAAPSTVVALILSDVIDDPLDVIASGPTAPDPSTYAEAWEIIRLFGLEGELPDSVTKHIREGAQGLHEETPKPGDPLFARVKNYIIGNNRLALDAAAREAEKAGYHPLILSSSMRGEARETVRALVSIGEEVKNSGRPVSPPACLIAGGETTVTLGESAGKGGRNQEMALAAAIELSEKSGLVFLAAGTDGTDGPTDAAGAVVDGQTVVRGQKLKRNAQQYLARHDAYSYFTGMDEHIITGPTRTNVMDVYLLLADRNRACQ